MYVYYFLTSKAEPIATTAKTGKIAKIVNLRKFIVSAPTVVNNFLGPRPIRAKTRNDGPHHLGYIPDFTETGSQG